MGPWAAALATPFGILEMRLGKCSIVSIEPTLHRGGELMVCAPVPKPVGYRLTSGMWPAEPTWFAATEGRKIPGFAGSMGILAMLDDRGGLTRPTAHPPAILVRWLAEHSDEALAAFLAGSKDIMGWTAPEPAIQPPPQ